MRADRFIWLARVGAALLALVLCATVARADDDPLAKPKEATARDHFSQGSRCDRVREADLRSTRR